MTLGDLKQALDVSRYKTIQWVKVALKEKAVVATGVKAHYRLHLPGKSPAKSSVPP